MFIDATFTKLKRHKFFSEFFSKETAPQLIKYLIVGFSTLGIEILLFWFFWKITNSWYIFANVLAYMFSFVYNFLMNRFWSFKSNTDFAKQLINYTLLFAFNLLASTIIIYSLTEYVGFLPMISKLFAMGAIVSWNFVLYKKVIYK